jgi:hypothetical protein
MNLSSLPMTQLTSQFLVKPLPGKKGIRPSSWYLLHTNVLVQFCVSLLTGLSFSQMRT